MAGLISSVEVKELNVDHMMEGAKVALLCDGRLHISPAMYAALQHETEEAWRSMRVLRVPSVSELSALKLKDNTSLKAEYGLEWPSGGRKVALTEERDHR